MALLKMGPLVNYRDGSKLAILYTDPAGTRITLVYQTTDLRSVGGGQRLAKLLCDAFSKVPFFSEVKETVPVGDLKGNIVNIVFDVNVSGMLESPKTFVRSIKRKIDPVIERAFHAYCETACAPA